MVSDNVRPNQPCDLPAWLQPNDADTLFGIEAIARYLALPFLDVRTMIGMGRLPTWRVGRNHSSRRSTLAAYWLDLEKQGVSPQHFAPIPADIAPDGCLGLLCGQADMMLALGMTRGAIRHHRARNALPVFKVGKNPFARLASLQRWQIGTAGETRATRWYASIAATKSEGTVAWQA